MRHGEKELDALKVRTGGLGWRQWCMVDSQLNHLKVGIFVDHFSPLCLKISQATHVLVGSSLHRLLSLFFSFKKQSF
jgi:hypothetical protein